ncbi:TolC family protein [Paenibacillus thailandensis]|uniref:TolC family protein n=1 Tax=Paenibacillus thailandensis TaxID=393250 RepID=A0ABW5QZP4_9BACL
MRKTIVYGTIAAMAIACAQPAFASSSAEDTAAADAALDSSFADEGELERVDSLDLETALSRAINDSDNLALLELKYEALGQKQKDLEKTADDLEEAEPPNYALPGSAGSILSDPDYQIPEDATPDQLLWLGPVVENNAITNGLMQGMIGMIEGMNGLIASQRNQAEVAAKQMENNRANTELDQAEAKEGIALQMTGQYIQLLGERKQIELLEDYIEVLEGDVAKAEALQQAGMASADDIEQLQRQIAAQKDSLKTVSNNYQLGLVQLSFDLGIAYNPDVSLEPVEFTVPAAADRTDTETILAGSFELKRLYNNINQAEWEKDHTDTSTSYGDSYLQTSVELAEKQADQAKTDLRKAIESLYTEADNAYSSYAAAARVLEEQRRDYEKMKLRYEYGLISAHDLNDFAFQVQQYETKAEIARLQAFMLSRQIEAMERGFIQS